jgi:hypothetical protein
LSNSTRCGKEEGFDGMGRIVSLTEGVLILKHNEHPTALIIRVQQKVTVLNKEMWKKAFHGEAT